MIKDSLIKTVQKFRMIEKGETLFVGVSGGCDSSALLHLLIDLAPSWKLKLAVLHVNHKLRGKASDQDEAFVHSLAKKYKIPFFSTAVPVKELAQAQKQSLEEAARNARYEFFQRMIETKGAQKLVLAHTLDDQAETVLMRIINGTGLQGLQAIRPKRKLNGAYLIRPLIEISRNQIRSYAKEKRIKFREDKSNKSLQFVRNKIRLKLIPFLEKEFNPQVKKALARLPHLLDVDLSFLEETADEFYRRLAIQDGNKQISFPKKSFLELKPSIQYRLIQRALQKLGSATLDYDHWNQFLGSLMTEDYFKLQFPKGLIAIISNDQIKMRHAKQNPVSFLYSLEQEQSIYISELNATLSCRKLSEKPKILRKSDKSFEIFDGDSLSFPLTIRSREAGDRLQPLGQSKRTKLKSLLINKRIPVEKRDHLPIILSKNQVAWVAGVTMSDPYKISSKTNHFIKLSLKSENHS